jgi:hypothetical protein
MTDVDEPFRKAPTGQLAEQVQLRNPAMELLDDTEQAFYEGSTSVLAEQAALLPPQGGTSSGAGGAIARLCSLGACDQGLGLLNVVSVH